MEQCLVHIKWSINRNFNYCQLFSSGASAPEVIVIVTFPDVLLALPFLIFIIILNKVLSVKDSIFCVRYFVVWGYRWGFRWSSKRQKETNQSTLLNSVQAGLLPCSQGQQRLNPTDEPFRPLPRGCLWTEWLSPEWLRVIANITDLPVFPLDPALVQLLHPNQTS